MRHYAAALASRYQASSNCTRAWVTTTGYDYSLVIGDNVELWAMHWHAQGRSHETKPHLHLGDTILSDHAPVTSNSHLRTGRMTFETALLALSLITLVVVLRLALWLRNRTLRRGKLPMIIHLGARPGSSSPASVGGSPADSGAAPPAADAAAQADRLATEVRAYIEADSRVLHTPAPGGGNLTAPPAQTQVPDQPGQWVAFLLALATPAKRHYDAWINTETVQGTSLRAYLEITRSPGDQLMLAEVVTAETADELVGSVACACLHHLRQQSAVRRRTPRWEQWPTREGYRQFRRGLELEDTLPEGSLGVDGHCRTASQRRAAGVRARMCARTGQPDSSVEPHAAARTVAGPTGRCNRPQSAPQGAPVPLGANVAPQSAYHGRAKRR